MHVIIVVDNALVVSKLLLLLQLLLLLLDNLNLASVLEYRIQKTFIYSRKSNKLTLAMYSY